MLITKRGTWWEVLHSWWLLLTFAPFALTAFLAFFYIGYRAKNKKWLKYGLIYFIILAIAFVLPSTPGVYIVLPLWGISIIHGLKVRAAYLIQLDVFKQNVEARAFEAVRHEAEAKFGGKPAHRIDLTKQR
ncbi:MULTISPECIES: hypothetical protein [Bacillus amyloliquefaciens group]|uniref:Uncharacterized protein n=1 Tax=Bacillus amyloliquefaciens TaxID=1390 RepID=A0AAP3YDG4_BACAM|nr:MULTISPECIES: hypothetical protein [Bacillus amyloliquefaciens group]ERH54745.1 membrane protein [Bacillus amyloliquefaciens EGD-AQ14]MDF4193682.1 hypothetical protein [Bacillus amyloliquefaciens]MDF4212382.1 hypothetical protein [Bacillus amyloliquefaciens]MDH3124310.1 hypothetical protein [Bacillus velezensis]WRT06902.1 hypothetical protein VO177_04985 [Bacillus velezensis]